MWHTIPHMLAQVLATTPWVSQLVLSVLTVSVWCALVSAPPESEARPESGEVAAVGFACGWLPEPEEGVALHRTLPQVFAALGAGQLEHKRMLLLAALRSETVLVASQLRMLECKAWAGWQDTNLIIVLHHNQRESTLFKVQTSDFGPEQQSHTQAGRKNNKDCISALSLNVI